MKPMLLMDQHQQVSKIPEITKSPNDYFSVSNTKSMFSTPTDIGEITTIVACKNLMLMVCFQIKFKLSSNVTNI